jgi:hypothetical protein
MRPITLNPTGLELVQFRGELLGESRQFIATRQNPNLRRGIHVSLYRREDGKHVAAMTYESTRPRERCVCWVMEGETLDDVAALVRLRGKDALPEGMGFPPGPEYAGRQNLLQAALEQLTNDALTFSLSQATHP